MPGAIRDMGQELYKVTAWKSHQAVSCLTQRLKKPKNLVENQPS